MHTLYKLNKTEKIVFTNKIYTYDVNKIIFKIYCLRFYKNVYIIGLCDCAYSVNAATIFYIWNVMSRSSLTMV